MKFLEEKTIQTDKIYKGKLLDVRKDKVKPAAAPIAVIIKVNFIGNFINF